MRKYQSIQFAPDGDFITDYHADSVAEVWDIVNDQGSRWYFYPLPFVITAGQIAGSRQKRHGSQKRIVSCPDGFEKYKGCTVAKVASDLASLPNAERKAIFS